MNPVTIVRENVREGKEVTVQVMHTVYVCGVDYSRPLFSGLRRADIMMLSVRLS